jgi:M3 family oligoendopeptidase
MTSPPPALHLSELTVTRPDPEALAAAANKRIIQAENAGDGESLIITVLLWDRERRAYETQRQLASIRFSQNTRDESARADKQAFDDIDPVVQGYEVELLRAVLGTGSGCRTIEEAFGVHAIALWRCMLFGFEPAIADDKRQESALVNRYQSLLASIKPIFRGQNCSLSTIRSFYGLPDRSARLDALQAEDTALSAHTEAFDAILDDLVKTRHRMAQTLHQPSFTSIGYAWRRRTDWTPRDAATFRDAVRQHVVPLADRIRARRARDLGVTDPGLHDEYLRDAVGAPKAQGDATWLLDRTQEALTALIPDLGALTQTMRDRGMLDLIARDGKSGGGFCEVLPDQQIPFILANFNGTQEDLIVLVHELGHAFQSYRSLKQPLLDYLAPTFETAEVHSMSLEFLIYPELERVFGADAPRFRDGHLERALLFLPYGCAIDHFQHDLYDNPTLTPDQRAARWRELEGMYMPSRRYQDMPFFDSGRFFQKQAHIFSYPFYYLDYALAQTCALQLWDRSRTDQRGAIDTYTQLCDLGGSRSFTDLLSHTGLGSPFDPDMLPRLMKTATDALGL